MQFIPNGPDIPDELLTAHEEGRVVFFCGAGISYPAGLPGFGGLVEEIYRRNGTTRTPIEQDAKRGQFDATLDLLERRLKDIVARYIAEHLPKLAKTNAGDQVSILRKMVQPAWGNRLVTEITKSDVAKLLDFVAEGRPRPSKPKPNNRARKLQGHKPTPIRANRMGEVLRKMFTLAVEWEWRTDNPAQGFHRRIEHARETFLSPDELTRLARVLDGAEDQRAAAIIRLCMLTGARVGEVRTAQFDQFNLDYAIWSKPASTTKRRKIHRVPISQEVATIVRLRQQVMTRGNPWLFPGETVGQP